MSFWLVVFHACCFLNELIAFLEQQVQNYAVLMIQREEKEDFEGKFAVTFICIAFEACAM